jgi:DNA-directed RNA polymerase subunit RPC12/RpoP
MPETLGEGSFDCGTCGEHFEASVLKWPHESPRVMCPACETYGVAIGWPYSDS